MVAIVLTTGNRRAVAQVETIAPTEAMDAMARKTTGGKVRLTDPATGKFVWVDRAQIHSTADGLDEPAPTDPAQGHSDPLPEPPRASPESPSASIALPVPSSAPIVERDEFDEFYDPTPAHPSPAQSVHRPATSSRASTDDDIADFWNGDDMQAVEPAS